MIKNIRRIAAVAALGLAPIVVTTGAANAGGAPDNYKLHGAETRWLERGPVPGLLKGNVHRGSLHTVSNQANPEVFETTGFLEAWNCPKGVQPPPLHTANTPDQPTSRCTFTGSRTLTFASPSLAVGKGLATAHVTGVATARDSSGVEAPVRLRVNVSWHATAPADRETIVMHDEDDNGNPVVRRVTYLSRTSTVSGHVGAIGLGDERSDVTVSRISSQQQTTRPA